MDQRRPDVLTEMTSFVCRRLELEKRGIMVEFPGAMYYFSPGRWVCPTYVAALFTEGFVRIEE